MLVVSDPVGEIKSAPDFTTSKKKKKRGGDQRNRRVRQRCVMRVERERAWHRKTSIASQPFHEASRDAKKRPRLSRTHAWRQLPRNTRLLVPEVILFLLFFFFVFPLVITNVVDT